MNFIKKRGWLLIFVGSMIINMPLNAVEVKGLFEIEVVALSESAEDREQATKQALFAVLDRVLIADDIAKIPTVQQMLLAAQHYVKQSQYSLLPADDQADTGLRLFRVQFDEDQVLEALRKSQVGIWSEIRPDTLLWLVVDADGSRQFYNADSMPDIEHALLVAAKQKGLPLIYPILDLEEQQKVSIHDVLGTDSRALLAASARYEVPAVMAARLAKKQDCWQGDWAFYFDGKIKQWSTSCQSLKATLAAGIKGAYLILANYYGIKPEAPVVPASH